MYMYALVLLHLDYITTDNDVRVCARVSSHVYIANDRSKRERILKTTRRREYIYKRAEGMCTVTSLYPVFPSMDKAFQAGSK